MIFRNLKLGLVLGLAVFFTTGLSAGKAQQQIVTDKAQLAKLKAAVEANPDSYETNLAYIRALGFDAPELISQYEEWITKYPANPMLPFVIGESLSRSANPKGKSFLQKALAIKPNYAAAWSALASDAELQGNFEDYSNYLGKAAAAAPDNADYAFQYASSFSAIDKEKYRKQGLDFISRFPEHQRAAQSLYWLAHRTTDDAEKIKYYERSRKEYPAAKYSWAAYSMGDYFNILLQSDIDKATSLAEEMAAVKEFEKEWSALLTAAKGIAAAKKLMQQKKGAEALAVLNQVKLPKRSSSQRDLLLWKAQANDLAGHTNVAYDSLMVAFAKSPSPVMKQKLVFYGKKMGKNAAGIEAEIGKRLTAVAAPATTFNLKNYFTNGNTSLEDYKGKVVLLTYWYPGCGPCRNEFPYFENVARKFKGQDFIYVGINIYPKQSEYVIPFVKGSGYSFIPLEDVKDRNKGNMDNRGLAPMNFMIDKEGRLVFSDFRTDAGNEDELEMMISMLLAGKKG